VRRLLPAILFTVLLLPGRAWAASPGLSSEQIESELAHKPYNYLARQLLVDELRQDGSYASAYWHAAWLTWLASRQYSDSDEGAGLLRDRRNRDRAASWQSEGLTATIAAVDAQHLLYDSCLNGSIAQQAERIRREIAAMLAHAEEADAKAGRNDPVARMALVQLGITLDDAILLDTTGDDHTSRLSVLRIAATRAAAVAAWLPQAPGPHRSLAIIRARLADLPAGRRADMDGRGELWDTAIAEADRALELDPSDPYLPELLWTLHLRAGHWTQAAAWQAKVEETAKLSSR